MSIRSLIITVAVTLLLAGVNAELAQAANKPFATEDFNRGKEDVLTDIRNGGAGVQRDLLVETLCKYVLKDLNPCTPETVAAYLERDEVLDLPCDDSRVGDLESKLIAAIDPKGKVVWRSRSCKRDKDGRIEHVLWDEKHGVILMVPCENPAKEEKKAEVPAPPSPPAPEQERQGCSWGQTTTRYHGGADDMFVGGGVGGVGAGLSLGDETSYTANRPCY